ncbi:MAG: hypothetical protein JSU85_04555 [Candidatus Zixiibacteriota bacterium]|nr:MAG: hypothetical protein JSU85_04555 [candidate division Zixibacteria bacterium]
MDAQPARMLLIHGSIVILSGLLSGIPFWAAVIRGRDDGAIRSWRVAHTTLIACGLVMLAIGLISPRLALSEGLRSFMVWMFVASGYGFVFALVVGAGTGYRALTPTPAGVNTLLFMGHLIGAVGSILGMCVVLYGLLQSK